MHHMRPIHRIDGSLPLVRREREILIEHVRRVRGLFPQGGGDVRLGAARGQQRAGRGQRGVLVGVRTAARAGVFVRALGSGGVGG